MEASVAGVTGDEALQDLRDTLEGLSGTPGAATCELRVVMRSAPLAEPDGGGGGGSARTEIALLHDTAEAGGGSWRVRHESKPMVGKKAEELNAAVREVVSAGMHHGCPVDLFSLLGFQKAYESVRRGHRFLIRRGPHTIEVMVCELCTLGAEGGDENGHRSFSPGLWLVEARSFAATPEAYPAAVAALDALREQLAHIVALEKYCGPGGVAAPTPSRWGAGRGAVARSGPGQGAGAAGGRGEPAAPLGEYASRLSGKRRRRKTNPDGSLWYPPGHPLAAPPALPAAGPPEAAPAAGLSAAGLPPPQAALSEAAPPVVQPLLPFLDTSMH